MTQGISSSIVFAFAGQDPDGRQHTDFSTETLGGGLINHTFRVNVNGNEPFLLQQINRNVFPQPLDVQENYIRIWEYARKHANGVRLPAPLFTKDAASMYIDDHENHWRAFEFLQHTRSYPVAGTPAQAAETARTFAAFTASFGAFDAAQLKPVIPGFHDLALRYQQFETSLQHGNTARMKSTAAMIRALQERSRYRDLYTSIIHSADYPVRVMHHDAKIANILFGEADGQVICPVDFDTVMPGYFFSDLGDMIRSMASCVDENSTELETLCIRTDFYKAILDGYLSVMAAQFTETEKRNIHYAGIIMTYMQALRFLTDYLNNDIYYRISHPEHNHERALNQLTLLEKLESFLLDEYGFRA